MYKIHYFAADPALDHYIYVRHHIPAKPTLGSAGPDSGAQTAALATQSNPTKYFCLHIPAFNLNNQIIKL